jgi:hypothetical protein
MSVEAELTWLRFVMQVLSEDAAITAAKVAA